jgi:2-haloacid dehalogenase
MRTSDSEAHGARYPLILFDLDGTLLDFAASQRHALAATLAPYRGSVSEERVHEAYVALSAPLWRALEQGRLTRDELRVRRFEELAARCGLDLPAPVVADAYLDELMRHAHAIEGALAVCSALSVRQRLGIVTNGFEAVQHARVHASKLHELLAFVVTSEAAGAPKPASAVFERALELYGAELRPDQVLVVGDSLEADVEGGRRMGFATCWLNPEGRPAAAPHRPDYVIRRLEELLDIVEGAGRRGA